MVRWGDLNPQVDAILAQHPAAGHGCDEAARTLLLDPLAQTLSVRPRGRARFVVPKDVDLEGHRWFMHFTCELRQHCVDALTGSPGTLRAEYLATHWCHPDWLVLAPEELPGAV